MATLVNSHLVRCSSCGAERVLKVWSCGCAVYQGPNSAGEHRQGCSNSRLLPKHLLKEVPEEFRDISAETGWDTYFRHHTNSCGRRGSDPSSH